MPAKFVLKKGSTGKFRFNLHGTNGQVIASSESYSSKASALKGIEAVKRVAVDATVVDETPQRGKAGATATKDVGAAVKAAEREEGASNGRATRATKAAPAAKATKATSASSARKASGTTTKAAKATKAPAKARKAASKT